MRSIILKVSSVLRCGFIRVSCAIFHSHRRQDIFLSNRPLTTSLLSFFELFFSKLLFQNCRKMQQKPRNTTQRSTTHKTQHTTPHTAQNKHTTHNTQHNTQRTTHNTTHNTPLNTHTQHTTRNAQHTTHNTQHTTQLKHMKVDGHE